jgi:pilus assembly protein CpaB
MISLVLAVAAGGAVYMYLKAVPTVQAGAIQTVPVVVATTDMSFGTTLEEQHVRLVEFPSESVPVGSYSSVDSVLSHTTKVFLITGEPILASKLSGIGGGLSVRIPSSMRAMSLKINDVTGVSGFVLPGDRVDVVVTIQNAGGVNVAVTKTILQNIEVLAAGVKTETKGDHNITVQTVTVLVDPVGVEKLALGVNEGAVHLSLRNPVDHEVVASTSTDVRGVMGLANSVKAVARARTVPGKPVVTTRDPVAVERNTFTIIRDGKILKQESLTADDGGSGNN